ncbi:hypothetical protein DB35_26925 [Streptomyces abyssalis]|uniref:DUF4350 domain-containing protein n=1 Tax=Streptomyces abyssalis TaxID=933944 RepID=A0A1E7JJ86_9ACTN|nr:DUF4350 domain-containing protein [Streptomyces abyssalis]OEU87148.1 hypothetical protein DB35_26925 [Streptomyces abyssalis]OEU87682.1 hypothetical protein AN215_15050 [Streptomyces abyssalis]
MSDASGTSLSPTARQLWARARGLLLAAVILAVAGVIIAALRSGNEYGLLDPRSTADHGSKATAQLLRERGVDTKIVTTAAGARKAAGPGTTLLVSDPDALSRSQKADLRGALERGGRTVLIAPGPAPTKTLVRGVRAAAPATTQPTPPDCGFPTAERAGDAELGGVRYAVSNDQADACYLHQGLPSLLRIPDEPTEKGDRPGPGGDTVLLGSPAPLYNQRLDRHGNASLMIQLLGSRPHLVWYLPSSADASAPKGGERSFLDLLPEGWTWATVQLSIAAVLAALWRMRRLGPLVPEQLPVAVRASETTEGRARLYRRANARDRAADALRSATRARLASLAGVSAAEADSPQTLVPALARSAESGTHPRPHTGADAGPAPGTRPDPGGSANLHSLLFGPAPATDAELIQLADELDHLERRLTDGASFTRRPTDKERTQ